MLVTTSTPIPLTTFTESYLLMVDVGYILHKITVKLFEILINV